MAKYRIVHIDFWKNPIVSEEMTPEDKYFYLYLLTNPNTTQIGIYKITKKQMAFDLGYSIETVHSLMDRFIKHHKLIRYNPETRELAIKNWGKENLQKGGKPVMDCILSELKEVEDHSLIKYVAEPIHKQEIRSLYESFCKQEEIFPGTEYIEQDGMEPTKTECEEVDDTSVHRTTTRGQKEKEKKKQQQQKALNPYIVNTPCVEFHPNTDDVKEIIEFWDANGFGFSKVNAKQQLLAWLDDSSFLQPKELIVKALNIACANNKRRLSYVVGILKKWEDESLLTVEEIEAYEVEQKLGRKNRQATESLPAGRAIPRAFELDLTAGED